MKRTANTFVFLLFILSSFAQTGIPVPEMSSCDNLVSQLLTQYDIPGATFALAKDGKLVYMRGFGHADLDGQEATQPYHLFRIMSISKSITGIAVTKLVEDGQLSFSDKVFGPDGIFANNTYFNNATVTDNRIYDITVQHLLEHTGGWNQNVDCTPTPVAPYAWGTTNCDPISFPLHVSQVLGESNPVSEQALIRFLMEKGVQATPGTEYHYSNIGFLAVGLVIEEVTGMSYEDYVKTAILEPLGICDMHLARNLREDKYEREGEYTGNGFTRISAYGDGTVLPNEYGGLQIEAMDAHGGWIATARDMVQLLVSVDGFTSKPDILTQSSIQTMTTPSTANAGYAKGWSVNSFDNWWHLGALSGTASFWGRTANGYTWALILNKRIVDGNSAAFWNAVDLLPFDCIAQASSFPTHDLLDFPSQNSSDIAFNPINGSSATVSWTSGNGDARILLAREGSPVTEFPLDGIDYTANAAFGMGDDLGDGTYVVHNDGTNAFLLTGLDSTKTYYLRLFDYNKNTITGDHALYKLCGEAQTSVTTSSSTHIDDLAELGIRFFPNPAQDWLEIELPRLHLSDRVEIRNMQGQVLKQFRLDQTKSRLSISDLPPQIYTISFFKADRYIGSGRLVKF